MVEKAVNSPDARMRFWQKVSFDDSGCWQWTGAKFGSQGYAAFGYDGKQPGYGHRFAYEMMCGAIPEGQVVMHTCDNPACVNPAHLRLGTQQDNILDAARKGRWMSEARWKAFQQRERHPDGRLK